MQSEAQIQRDIMAVIGSRQDVRLWRINVIAAHTTGGGLVKSAPKGHADLAGIVAPQGRALYIEVKSAKGRLSNEQVVFGEMITKNGGLYVLARSVQDVLDVLP